MAEEAFFGVVGIRNASNTLLAIRNNLEHPETAAPFIYNQLEEAYDRKFDDWNGYLVETGTLRDSLTESGGPYAIRRAHNQAIEFGTSLPYARFHWKALLDLHGDTEGRMAEGMAAYFAAEAGTKWANPQSFGGSMMRWAQFLDDEDTTEQDEDPGSGGISFSALRPSRFSRR